MHMMTRVVFMGSPEFAVPTLRALTREYAIVGVITQPDKPAGRGRGMRPPAIKVEAAALGLPVMQPPRLSDIQALHQLQDWAPELIVVAAFGQILRTEVLSLPAHGCINVHASLLPRWRGAAPIQAAIAAGDSETGVTIMKMDKGLDTGDILAQRSETIRHQDTAESLSRRLSEVGAELLMEKLREYLSGVLMPVPQDPSRATKAPILRKEDGLLDPSLPAVALERRVRAFNPWPGAYIDWTGGRLKIHRAYVADTSVRAGTRLILQGEPALAAMDGALVLDEVQPAGRKSMSGRAFLAGNRNWAT
jgi:methionyl-tRNA formyltransferase